MNHDDSDSPVNPHTQISRLLDFCADKAREVFRHSRIMREEIRDRFAEDLGRPIGIIEAESLFIRRIMDGPTRMMVAATCPRTQQGTRQGRDRARRLLSGDYETVLELFSNFSKHSFEDINPDANPFVFNRLAADVSKQSYEWQRPIEWTLLFSYGDKYDAQQIAEGVVYAMYLLSVPGVLSSDGRFDHGIVEAGSDFVRKINSLGVRVRKIDRIEDDIWQIVDEHFERRSWIQSTLKTSVKTPAQPHHKPKPPPHAPAP